ncbi:hypothetical protein BLOT_014183 [Blomia tropicalis]|nr:hypothetical protein BLOT_014183 [Blomia tropicalis]
MKFLGMVFCLITNHFCEFQPEIPKDSTQNRIQIDSFFGAMSINLDLFFVAWILMKLLWMVFCLITNHFCEFQLKNPKDSTQNRNKKAFIRIIGKCNVFLW